MARRIIFPEQGQVALRDFEPPAPEAGQIRVKTRYSLISIGTETTILHAKYDPSSHFGRMFSFPQLKTGVQAIATVEEVGHEVDQFAVGDTIFMRHAHASHWTLAADACSLVAPGLDLKAACWCGLAKTAFRAAHAAPFALGGEVLIIGAGPVGQMALRWAAAAGMRRIVVADVSGKRLGFARRGGATHIFEGAIEALLEEGGAPLIVDTTGNAAVFAEALRLLAPLGKLVLLGDTGFPGRQSLTSDMMMKGLTVVATHDHRDRDGWTQRQIDALFFDLLGSGRFDASGLITHEFTPEDCAEAYALASDNREDAVGILFDWTR